MLPDLCSLPLGCHSQKTERIDGIVRSDSVQERYILHGQITEAEQGYSVFGSSVGRSVERPNRSPNASSRAHMKSSWSVRERRPLCRPKPRPASRHPKGCLPAQRSCRELLSFSSPTPNGSDSPVPLGSLRRSGTGPRHRALGLDREVKWAVQARSCALDAARWRRRSRLGELGFGVLDQRLAAVVEHPQVARRVKGEVCGRLLARAADNSDARRWRSRPSELGFGVLGKPVLTVLGHPQVARGVEGKIPELVARGNGGTRCGRSRFGELGLWVLANGVGSNTRRPLDPKVTGRVDGKADGPKATGVGDCDPGSWRPRSGKLGFGVLGNSVVDAVVHP